jgi:hypothetical protein
VTGVLMSCSAPDHVQTLVPAEMRRSGKLMKAPDGRMGFWGNGALETNVEFEKGPVTITVRAKGNYSNGDWPKIYIALNDHVIAAILADSKQMQDYTVKASVPHRGRNLLRLRLVNHIAVPGKPLAGRNLTIARIVLEQRYKTVRSKK